MRKNWFHTAVAASLAAVVLLSGCSTENTAVSAEAVTTALAVQTARPVLGNLSRSTKFIGTIQPDKVVPVLPKIAGTVLSVTAKVGDEVKEGDVLFTIDTTDVEIQLASQRAGIAAAQASVVAAQAQIDQQLGSTYDIQMTQLETQLQSAQNQYATARQNLRDYYDGRDSQIDTMIEQRDTLRNTMPLIQAQYEGAMQAEIAARAAYNAAPQNPALKQAWDAALVQMTLAQDKLRNAQTSEAALTSNINGMDDEDVQGASLRTVVRNAQLAYESANSVFELTDTDAREAAVKTATAQLAASQAQVAVQQAAYNAAAVQLEYAAVKAPIDGIVEACSVSEKGLVSQSTVSYTITNKDSMSAVFYVSADAVGQMAVGDSVTVTVNNTNYDGEITEAGTMVDNTTGLFKMKCSVKNAGFIMTGIAATIEALTDKAQDALLVPQDALYYEEGKAYVYVNQEGYARKLYVEAGVSNNESVQIVSGLTADMQVVTSWNPNMRDGVALVVEDVQ